MTKGSNLKTEKLHTCWTPLGRSLSSAIANHSQINTPGKMCVACVVQVGTLIFCNEECTFQIVPLEITFSYSRQYLMHPVGKTPETIRVEVFFNLVLQSRIDERVNVKWRTLSANVYFRVHFINYSLHFFCSIILFRGIR